MKAAAGAGRGGLDIEDLHREAARFERAARLWLHAWGPGCEKHMAVQLYDWSLQAVSPFIKPSPSTVNLPAVHWTSRHSIEA